MDYEHNLSHTAVQKFTCTLQQHADYKFSSTHTPMPANLICFQTMRGVSIKTGPPYYLYYISLTANIHRKCKLFHQLFSSFSFLLFTFLFILIPTSHTPTDYKYKNIAGRNLPISAIYKAGQVTSHHPSFKSCGNMHQIWKQSTSQSLRT